MISKKKRSPITTHVLDLGKGRPARGIAVTLEMQSNGKWKQFAQRKTDHNGRIEDFLPGEQKLKPGLYRMRFETRHTQKDPFFSEVSLSFYVKDPKQHYHVPLLISPYGYSTYRGS